MDGDGVGELDAQPSTAPAALAVHEPPAGQLRPVAAPHVHTAGCGGPATDLSPASYVYAIGKVEARFPHLSIEKEFAQVTGRADTAGQTDAYVLHAVLSAPENRHLARAMCWVLTVRDIETYILYPRDPVDLNLLVEAIRPVPDPSDLDVVIGRRGPIAPAELCNGLMVPVVAVDQIYSFDRQSLIDAIPRPKSAAKKQFDDGAAHVLAFILSGVDNAGATDEHRALNYLAMRYPEIYRVTVERFANEFSLTAIDVRPSALGGGRSVVDCIFSYTNRRSGFTEKSVVAVDVADEYPFLVSGMAAYFDRFST